MAEQFTVNRDDPKQSLQALIFRTGFDPADFEIKEDQGVHDIDVGGHHPRVLTLRRRGTSLRCSYQIVSNGPWLFAPFSDLTSGRYGSPGRTSRPNFLGS
ncbi:MAG: hypothetical protein CFE43_09310 [Burkholderiales bacterium PBB3]|nr:MAG: hypothetical protein CFE43_09310 [Burkholderiales bacterium PBB3]